MRKKGFHAVFALLIPSADIGCATTIAASRPISEQTASELSDAIEGHYARVLLFGLRGGMLGTFLGGSIGHRVAIDVGAAPSSAAMPSGAGAAPFRTPR